MSEKFSGSLMGMGNPLLDISANVDQAFLDKYEVKLDTAVLADEKHTNLYKDMIDNCNVSYIAGGATQNSCRVAQWMLSAAGSPKNTVAFMGAVGNDSYGKQLQECASSDGVYVHYMKDEATPTGTCACLIVNSERGLVANLAAANNFKKTHLDTPEAQAIIESSQIYYSAGFFLTVSVESLVHVAEDFVSKGKLFCLNLSAPFIVEFFAEQVKTALAYADFVFCNESEAETYAKVNNIEGDLGTVAQSIAKLPKKSSGPRTVIFTQGSKSTIVATAESVQEYPVEALPADQLVDTNGAGDAFVGGFLAELVRKQDIQACVTAGHYAARHIIQVSGTTLDGVCEYYK